MNEVSKLRKIHTFKTLFDPPVVCFNYETIGDNEFEQLGEGFCGVVWEDEDEYKSYAKLEKYMGVANNVFMEIQTMSCYFKDVWS